MFRSYSEIADGFQAAFKHLLDRLQELDAAEESRQAQDVRMTSRRGAQLADDLTIETKCRATIILSRELREELRAEVLRRQKDGEVADVSALVREACRSYLEAIHEEPRIVDLEPSGRRRAV